MTSRLVSLWPRDRPDVAATVAAILAPAVHDPRPADALSQLPHGDEIDHTGRRCHVQKPGKETGHTLCGRFIATPQRRPPHWPCGQLCRTCLARAGGDDYLATGSVRRDGRR